MKINYTIIGSDENPLYYDFWPIVSKVWRMKFGIIPVLGLISDEDSDLYEDEFGLVKKFKKVGNISTGLQSQIVRFYLPKFLNGNCLVSDIDMIPLSQEYFESNSKYLDEENIVLLSSDNPECLADKMYPMCYFVSHTKTFNKLFDLDLTWEQFVIFLNNRNQGWYTDQKYLYEKINHQNGLNVPVVHLKRGWSGMADRRIDRYCWGYDDNLVTQGYYIDSHSLRPYSEYKKQINKLIELLFL